MRKLVQLNAQQVHALWPAILAKIAESPHSLAYADPQELLEDVEDAVVQSWALKDETDYIDMALFTVLEVVNGKRVWTVVGAWGQKPEAYVDMLIEELPKIWDDLAADEMVIEGRFGWARVLRRIGFVTEPTRMVKKITRVLH